MQRTIVFRDDDREAEKTSDRLKSPDDAPDRTGWARLMRRLSGSGLQGDPRGVRLSFNARTPPHRPGLPTGRRAGRKIVHEECSSTGRGDTERASAVSAWRAVDLKSLLPIAIEQRGRRRSVFSATDRGDRRGADIDFSGGTGW